MEMVSQDLFSNILYNDHVTTVLLLTIWCIWLTGELSYQECLKGNISALEEFLDNLEDNDPAYRSRTSQQAWLPVDGDSDPVLLSLRKRYTT
jgi:hypothetical protein